MVIFCGEHVAFTCRGVIQCYNLPYNYSVFDSLFFFCVIKPVPPSPMLDCTQMISTVRMYKRRQPPRLKRGYTIDQSYLENLNVIKEKRVCFPAKVNLV